MRQEERVDALPQFLSFTPSADCVHSIVGFAYFQKRDSGMYVTYQLFIGSVDLGLVL